MVKLLKAESVNKENLLLNGDFRTGVINQQGATSYQKQYTTGLLSIDGCILENKLKLEVGDGYIVLSQDSSLSYTGRARFKLKTSVAAGNYVVTYNVLENTCTSKNIDVTNGGSISAKETGLIHQYVNSASGFSELVFYIPVGGSIKISFIKVEQGTVYTGMPVWNEAEQLLKCMSYYQILYRIPIHAASTTATTYFIDENMFIPMRKSPSYTVTEVLNSSAVKQSVSTTNISLTKKELINITLSSSISQFGYITVYLDAYDY